MDLIIIKNGKRTGKLQNKSPKNMKCYKLILLVFLFGCASNSPKLITTYQFTDKHTALTMNVFENWEVLQNDKNIGFVIRTKPSFGTSSSSRIEGIQNQIHSESLIDIFESEKHRVSLFYTHITFLEPMVSEHCGLTILESSYDIPSAQISDDSKRNQFSRSTGTSVQPVKLKIIKASDDKVLILHAYLGEGEQINNQALDILNSIMKMSEEKPCP